MELENIWLGCLRVKTRLARFFPVFDWRIVELVKSEARLQRLVAAERLLSFIPSV